MASSSSSALSFPSSSLSRTWDHDVFPSFHGPDLRKSFLCHLLKEFRRKAIKMFIDNEIKRGESIGPELERAIKGSKIAVVLLSKNYASSSWCLNELVEIMKRESGQMVVTIFYEVDPTDVKKQTGDFGKVFRKTCKDKGKEKTEIWRKALEGVATIAGYHSSNWVDGAAMIENIAADISIMLIHLTTSCDFDHLIGMRDHMKRMIPLLRLDLDEVRMIGIWGPPGIGKTTIARFLFNQISSEFQHSAVMANIKRSYPKPCLNEYEAQLQLQSQMLSRMINEKDIIISHLGVAQGLLGDRNVLLVLDDVDQSAQLDALAKNSQWFGPRSRIIITTEDLSLLKVHGINHIYKVDFPSNDEALQMFCMYAFDQKYPKDGFDELSREITSLVGKLPLALKVMGSHFRRLSKEQWSMEVPRLWTNLNGEIENVLKFSCDALCDEEKELFLHIACFFNNEYMEKVEAYLAESFVNVRQGLHVLAEKSLISIDQYGHIRMPAKEMMRETECILVFSCNDSHDVDETHFIRSILEGLHEREVIPMIYNLSARGKVDTEMLYKYRVGIMVLSNSCASSTESLDLLVEIMEHGKATNLIIIPIYFKVTLSDMCELEGRFEETYLQYLNSAQPGRVQNWKAALAEIMSMAGHEWIKGTQVALAEEVVRDACLRLYLKNSKNLVTILELLTQSKPSDADIVGLWGMAGIGKTSIAKEIFGTLAPQYDLCYFLQDFYIMSQMKGLRQMRDDFYSKLFGEVNLSISASDVKLSFLRDWFHKKTILVVLDDVSNARDAEAVVGGFGWFSHGHRIIITSRTKQVLVQCKVKEPYKIQRLTKFESLRLCKQYLKGESGVISELLSCSSGIPLALKVLGSSVLKQHTNNMMEHLQKLRRNPPTQIQEAFRRSFDELDENEKNIFLDLACFFRGENKDHVVELLDACGFLTYLGIYNLIDESLISLLDKRIEMPIPFQDMGRFIVHEEDKDPCERSRLWDSNEIIDVLTKKSGTEVIEGIFLDASDLTCELSPIVFANMYRLRLLKFYCSSRNQCKLSLPQGLDTLPDELRLLHWENYSLEYLPQKFNPENLVEINMPYSNMEKLWEGEKDLKKLKKIKLSHSKKLTDILVLSGALNLEHIDLEGCTSLVDVSTSIPRSGKLISLNMKYCFHLRSLPTLVDSTSLKLLNLSSCSELDEIQDFAPNLKELYLAGTAIRELPLSIENLTELVTLDLENCRRLQLLPSGIRNLRSIVELKLPDSVQYIYLNGCSSLVSLPKLPDSLSLNAENCESLEKLDCSFSNPRL